MRRWHVPHLSNTPLDIRLLARLAPHRRWPLVDRIYAGIGARLQRALRGRQMSLACHTRDQALQLDHLLASSLGLPGVREFVVVDHRSSPDVRATCERWRPEYWNRGVALRRHREDRPLAANFTFADLRQGTVDRCRHPIVCLLDADFVLGEGFVVYLAAAARAFLRPDVYAAGYAIPIVQDHWRLNGAGTLVDHGRCELHVPVPRIFLRDHVVFRQDHEGGRLEWPHPRSPDRHRWRSLPALPDTLFSDDVRDDTARSKRVASWENYFEQLRSGELSGSYDNALQRGQVRSGWHSTDFAANSGLRPVDLRGQRFRFADGKAPCCA